METVASRTEERTGGDDRSTPRERALAAALLVAGTAAILLAHWPGWLVPDSVANIGQLRSGWIGDHRSAVATWIWRQGWLAVGAGPGAVFVLQMAALLGGLQLALRAALRPIWAAAAAVAIVLSPPAFGFVAVLGRDMWFVSGCLLALGLAVGATRWPRRVAAVAIAAGVVLVTLAVAARQNGVTAVLPLMVALAAAGVARSSPERRLGALLRRRPRTSAVAAGALLTVLALAVSVLGTSAVRRVHEYPEVYTQSWDLGHMTIEHGERFFPQLPHGMQPTQTVAEVARRWTPTTSLYMRWDRDMRGGPDMYTADAAARLQAAWRDAIEAHPGTYLSGRFELWLRQIGIGHTPPYTFVERNAANPWGYDAPARPALTDATVGYAKLWSSTRGPVGGLLHHAWIYLLLCAGGLALLAPRHPLAIRMVGLLAAAGITAQVGLFLIAPSVQWRYQLLTAYAGMVVACVGVALAWRARTASRDHR